MSTTDSSTITTTTRSIWRAGLVTAVVAALANTVVYVLGLLTPASWEVDQGGQAVTVLPFLPAVASVMGIVVGTVALWVLARFSWGLTAWTVLAVLAGVGSVSQPVVAAQDTWTGVLLGTMHLVALGSALLLLRPAGLRSS
jgi:hypothetical protein